MKEFKSKYKYRIKEYAFRNGYKSYAPQYSKLGIFWHDWTYSIGIDTIVIESFSTKSEAEDFIFKKVESERRSWESKVVGTKIIKI